MITQADREHLQSCIRNIPDFPKKGIQFKDITTALKKPEVFSMIVDDISSHYMNLGITRVVAIESRGFITGGAIACRLGAGFVPIRKLGKLPAQTFSKQYDLEYGMDSLEIHQDALGPQDIVLLHDDLLATGGTALAAIELLGNFNIRQIYVCFIIELDFLQGRQRLSSHSDVYSLIHF
jgi:adenine phosphoribosyltransferase